VTMVSAPPTVTCVVITKNEERNHQDCLQSVHWVVEDAVIDAASSECTADLARGGGAKERRKPA